MTLIMKCQDQIKILHLLLFLCSYKPIVDYIDAQFENFLEEELKIKRSLYNYHDSRIHICLYFIAPTGHSLKSLDLVTMKKLDSKVSYSESVCHIYILNYTENYIIHVYPYFSFPTRSTLFPSLQRQTLFPRVSFKNLRSRS